MVRTLLIAKTMPAQNSSNNCASWTQANIMPIIPDQNQGLLHGLEFANSRKRANMRQGKNRASWKYTVQNHMPPESIKTRFKPFSGVAATTAPAKVIHSTSYSYPQNRVLYKTNKLWITF